MTQFKNFFAARWGIISFGALIGILASLPVYGVCKQICYKFTRFQAVFKIIEK